jgi:hypothetical protein
MSEQSKRTPQWVLGEQQTAPASFTKLVQTTVAIGKKAYIMGFSISTTDAAGNAFIISWMHRGQLKTILIVFGGQGTVKDTDAEIALNETFSADPQSVISIENLNNATVGARYQASLLIAEVTV